LQDRTAMSVFAAANARFQRSETDLNNKQEWKDRARKRELNFSKVRLEWS